VDSWVWSFFTRQFQYITTRRRRRWFWCILILFTIFPILLLIWAFLVRIFELAHWLFFGNYCINFFSVKLRAILFAIFSMIMDWFFLFTTTSFALLWLEWKTISVGTLSRWKCFNNWPIAISFIIAILFTRFLIPLLSIDFFEAFAFAVMIWLRRDGHLLLNWLLINRSALEVVKNSFHWFWWSKFQTIFTSRISFLFFLLMGALLILTKEYNIVHEALPVTHFHSEIFFELFLVKRYQIFSFYLVFIENLFVLS